MDVEEALADHGGSSDDAYSSYWAKEGEVWSRIAGSDDADTIDDFARELEDMECE